MMTWYLLYFLIFLAGLVAALALTPCFRALAIRCDLMDRPRSEQHKGHGRATPLLGGAAMFSAWLLVLALGGAALLFDRVPAAARELVTPHIAGAVSVAPRLGFVVLGAALAMLLGLRDDRRPMKAAPKFLGQFAVALIAVLLGGARLSFFCPWEWVGTVATLFWYMLLMNAINFFDNMDGLAVGTITIAMLFFAAVGALNGQYFVASLAALTAGVGAGFWYYNRHPAMLFMGDSGSLFLGYMAATVSVFTTYFRLDQSLSRLPVLLPFFILAVPLFDTAAVVLIRTRNRKPFWIGDHNHISHRFARMGLSRPAAVAMVHLLSIIISLGTLPLLWGDFRTAAVLAVQALLLLTFVSVLQIALARRDP